MIPQQEWTDGAPLGANELPGARGIVRCDIKAGSGLIARDEGGEDVFNFTAIPGQGYRTLQAGALVQFKLVESKLGLTARDVQQEGKEPME